MQIFAFLSELFESLITTSVSLIKSLIVAPTFGYMRWLIGLVWVPEGIEAIKYHKLFTKHIRTLAFVVLGSLGFSIPWDYFAIKDGIWYFPGSLVEIWFWGIPLEEYFFIVFVALFVANLTIIFKKIEAKDVRKV